jgi:hypothetical protein
MKPTAMKASVFNSSMTSGDSASSAIEVARPANASVSTAPIKTPAE